MTPRDLFCGWTRESEKRQAASEQQRRNPACGFICFLSFESKKTQQQQTTTKMPDGLEVSPDDELLFTLSPDEATPKTILTLKHPESGDSRSEPIAFKVGPAYIVF